MDAEAVRRAWVRVAHEIWERHRNPENLVLVGIRRRGEPLALRLATTLQALSPGSVESLTVAGLDIGPWRDDAPLSERPARPPEFPSTRDRSVVLVDDVLFTGRSVRAALDALAQLGRPRRVELAVLVDRGHRELPIRADYVGKNVPTALEERVAVRLSEADAGADGVDLVSWEDVT
jgi:pyrimidine operon attenuation protein/uracil phosphoribosyltransferase